ncbi:MAG: hypothetical protein ACK4XJ_08745 [Fimbriimonadaceae bacterium]
MARWTMGVAGLLLSGLLIGCGPKDEPPANEEKLRQAESRFQTSDAASDTPTQTGQSDQTTSQDE